MELFKIQQEGDGVTQNPARERDGVTQNPARGRWSYSKSSKRERWSYSKSSKTKCGEREREMVEGGVEEVSLRRMIMVAESRLRGLEGEEYKRSVEFEQHVKAASDLQAGLQGVARHKKELAALVAVLVAAGSGKRETLPAYCRVKKTSLSGTRARPRPRVSHSSGTDGGIDSTTTTATRAAFGTTNSSSASGRRGMGGTSSSSSSRNEALPPSSVVRMSGRERVARESQMRAGTADPDSAVLRQHAAAHEALTSDLAELSSRLKTRVEGVSAAVAARDAHLDRTFDNTASSLNATKGAVSRAGSLYRSGWRTGCMQWILIAIVGVVFAGVFVLIRLTSILGLKHQ